MERKGQVDGEREVWRDREICEVWKCITRAGEKRNNKQENI